jgi:DNA-binding transcriptional regulator GbsR (MarR family)
MQFEDAKKEFIQTWGTLGSNWGINRTMAQINGLLLIATEPLSTEDIMEELSISRGNANMNIRTLIDWGIVHKVWIAGERKEYFKSEKDVWKLASRIAAERRKKEIEPLIRTLNELQDAEGDSAEAEEFRRMNTELYNYSKKMDSILDKFIRSDENWFLRSIKSLLT